ncbi:MAG: SUMF1/EgtB/PvdO family nonheme iron enzyme [Planctomycetaceae bacterium]
MPFLLSAREASRRSACQNNLRQLAAGMNDFHKSNEHLPPAAVWSTEALHSLALHRSRRFDLFTHENWAQLLLPFLNQSELASQFQRDLPIGAAENEQGRTTRLPLMSCPSDTFNNPDNPYTLELDSQRSISFARGNYAVNGGTHCFNEGEGSTAYLTGDNAHLQVSPKTREFRFWGNGIAGFNVHFTYDDFENGTANLVALEELRAGVHSIDPRGAWAVGQIGGSVTWAHGVNGDAYGPNNQHPKSDDLLYGDRLNQVVGAEFLKNSQMPCVSYIDLNFQATSRSMHPGGVNVATVDGAVRFVSDAIDPGLWHVIHSRETPANVISEDLETVIARSLDIPDRINATSGISHPGTDSQPVIENSLGMKFVLLPAGEFEMGQADRGNSHDLPEESPQHRVRLSNAFYMGVHEVTRQQYDHAVVSDTESSNSGQSTETQSLPAVQVTWHDAADFCAKLSALPDEQAAGRRYRLPTEAEWEYACRGGDEAPYDWSGERRPNDSSGDAAGIKPPLPVCAVGSYAPNGFGLYDMRGNVWEWCNDWFARDYYSRSPVQDPQGPEFGYVKVVRGGCWTFVGELCKLSYPMMLPWKSSPFVGFRVVCELHPPKAM